jgi:hypothetical protein
VTDPGGALVFVPAPGESGDAYASFRYLCDDGEQESAVDGVVTIDIHVPDVPNAASKLYTVDEDAVTEVVLGRESVLKRAHVSARILSLPQRGRLFAKFSDGGVGAEIVAVPALVETRLAAGILTEPTVFFVPEPNESGNNYSSFRYAVHNGLVASAAGADGTLRFDVQPVNDGPTAQDVFATTLTHAVPVTLQLAVADVETPPGMLNATIRSLPARGSLRQFDDGAAINIVPARVTDPQLRVVYVPLPSGVYLASFDYVAWDGELPSPVAVCSVQVGTDNFAPVVQSAHAGATLEDTAVTITLRGSDADGKSLADATVLDTNVWHAVITALPNATTTGSLFQYPTAGETAAAAAAAAAVGTPIPVVGIRVQDALHRVVFVPARNRVGSALPVLAFRGQDATNALVQSAAPDARVTIDIVAVNDAPVPDVAPVLELTLEEKDVVFALRGPDNE